MTPLLKSVYALASKIPPGKVATYGQLASMAGHPQAARAVGLAMRQNPNPPIIPCHRVVGHDGSLVGYAGGGLTRKRKLLEAEGVKFRGPKVDLGRSRWLP